MASEAVVEGSEAAAAAVSTETVAAETASKHKLDRKWTFWFDNQSKPKQGAAWGTSLRKVYTFDTVEEFWWYAFLYFVYFFSYLGLILLWDLLPASSLWSILVAGL